MEKLTKVCCKCKIEKTLEKFYKSNKIKLGVTSRCKECIDNDLEIKKKHKEWYNKNKKARIECSKEWNSANKEYRKEYMREYSKKWREENKEKVKAEKKIWRKNHKKYFNKKNAEYAKKRLKSDPIFKFKCRTRGLVSNSFRRAVKGKFKKSDKTEKILGCTLDFFVEYIRSLLKEGMNFENYGNLWHIDHIIPICYGKTEEEIIKLNHYTNFQPMLAEENWKKGKQLNYMN